MSCSLFSKLSPLNVLPQSKHTSLELRPLCHGSFCITNLSPDVQTFMIQCAGVWSSVGEIRKCILIMTFITTAGFEPYRLTGVVVTEEEYGRGTYATVVGLEYRGLKCAGKKLHYVLIEEEEKVIVYRFEGECRLLAQMRHPNIVQFIGVYFEGDSEIPILVMEFLPTTLTRCIDTYGIPPEEVSYAILHDVAVGLYHLHSQTPPIVHRDLSANNVLLTPNMTAKISDLGVAKILNLTPLQLSRMTRAPGTLAYMPPEALSVQPRYDTRIDEFSCGVLMIHVLSGQWPFPCEPVRVNPRNRAELLPLSEAERRNKYLQDIGNAHPLMGLILRCVSNDPERRARAAEIFQQVEHMTRQSPPTFANRVEMLQRIRANATEKGSLKEKNETFAAEYERSRLEREELIQQHQAEVEQVRTEMRAQNETHQAEMRALNDTHRAEVEQVRTEVAAELNAQNTAAQTQLRGEIQRLEQLAQHRQEEIERSEIAHSIEIAETRLQLQETLQMELRAQTETHQAEMRAQNETHQAEMRSQNETHQTEMQSLRGEMRTQNDTHQVETKTQNETHQAEMRSQNETRQAEMRSQNETHQSQMKTQNETHQAKMRAQNETHRAEVEQVRTEMKIQNETHQAEMRTQNEVREHERRSLTNELDSLRSEVLRLRGVNESLQTTVGSRDETIQSNASEISSKKVTLTSKNATLTQKESELASKNAILERQSSTIREQNEQLTRAREFLSGQKPQV